MHRRLLLATAALGAALAVPAAAQARVVEIGQTADPVTPTCPKDCLAVSRTTGYQAKVGPKRGLMLVPQAGRIVAWSVALGNPSKKQIAFFDDKLGGESVAQITILRPGEHLRHRVVAQGEQQRLAPYFGTTPQFPLQRSIAVKKGWLVALTVPTWAPALAASLGPETSWRASRAKGACEDTQAPTTHTALRTIKQYYCLYKGARVTYSATLITTPKPSVPPSKK